MNIRSILSVVLAAACPLLASCGGGGGGGGGIGGTGSEGQGTLHVLMTDAPSCGYDAVNVSIERVRVHMSGSASDGDAGWSDIVLNPTLRVNLLSLTNGVLADLGQTPLPAGKYTQMRLVLAANDAAHPFANSVVPTGGVETELTTPSAQQSGLKLNVNIDVAPDKVADVVLDFDACKSVVKRGNSGKYNLKPVITVIPLLSDAGLRVNGFVDAALVTPATTISVQTNGIPVKATAPDANGVFSLYPVPVGTYDLVITSPHHVTGVITGVPVVSTAHTTLNTGGSPIVLPTATERDVIGIVVPPTATTRALQTLTNGPTVETGWAPVDAISGAFAFRLPIEAPVRAPYVASQTTYTFTTDALAGAHYTIESASAGVLKALAVDVSAPVPPLAFSFP